MACAEAVAEATTGVTTAAGVEETSGLRARPGEVATGLASGTGAVGAG